MGRVRVGGKRRTIKKWPPPLWRGLFLFCLVVDERVVHAEFLAACCLRWLYYAAVVYYATRFQNMPFSWGFHHAVGVVPLA